MVGYRGVNLGRESKVMVQVGCVLKMPEWIWPAGNCGNPQGIFVDREEIAVADTPDPRLNFIKRKVDIK